MESQDSAAPRDPDHSAAAPLEIDEATAAAAEDLLREFAEEAGVETALVVDRGGALVAGISAEAEVTVELISALVAGASGAMRALVEQLGESGALESLHLGGDRLIYLKETAERFVLVAVADASRPPGIVRRGALAIEGGLAEVLREVRPARGVPAGGGSATGRSLRALAKERAARREAELAVDPAEDCEDAEGGGDLSSLIGIPSEVEEPPIPCDEGLSPEETFETLDLLDDPDTEIDAEIEPGREEEIDATPSAEPKEIIEPIDFGEPEIVIEGGPITRLAIDSPFEAFEEPGEEEEEAAEEFFEELAEEAGDFYETLSPAEPLERPEADLGSGLEEGCDPSPVSEAEETAERLPETSGDQGVEAGFGAEEERDDGGVGGAASAVPSFRIPEVVLPEPSALLFELDDDDDDDDEDDEDEDDDDDDDEEEIADEEAPFVLGGLAESDTPRSLFEIDADEEIGDEEDAGEDEEATPSLAGESEEDDEDEEAGLRSSGPLYF